MSWQVIREPDGRLAVFCTTACGWIGEHLSDDQVADLFRQAFQDRLEERMRGLRKVVALVASGQAPEAYPVTWMTYEQAQEMSNATQEDE